MKKFTVSCILALVLILTMAPAALALDLDDAQPLEPIVYTSGDISCYAGDRAEISVSAQAPNGGNLSYQWYKSTDGSNVGGQPIQDATSQVYTVPTETAGDYYFYCVVTSSTAEGSAWISSDPIAVTVASPGIVDMKVERFPDKTVYNKGEELQSRGLQVRISYSNGDSILLSQGFGLSPTVLDTPGTQEIRVSYEGKSCSFTVTVEDKEEEVVQVIGVQTMPDKTDYKIGDALETRGLVIRVYSNLGQRDINSGFECSPLILEEEGQQFITVSFGGKTCSFPVNVEEAEPEIKGISVVTMPAKLQYTVGDKLDSSGLVIKVSTDKGSENITSGFACSPKVLTTAGTQEIKVYYQGIYSCTFTVNVAEKAGVSPSPSPTPTAVPTAQPTPEQTVQPLPSQSPADNDQRPESQREKQDRNILPVIILVAAVLALLSLGGYVYIMGRRGQR